MTEISQITPALFTLEKKGIIQWKDTGFTYLQEYEGNVKLAIAGYLDKVSVRNKINALEKERDKLLELMKLDVKSIKKEKKK